MSEHLNLSEVETHLKGKMQNGAYVTGTTDATPGTKTTHAHGLGRIPIGVIYVDQDKAGSIYQHADGHDATNIAVASDIASVTFKAYVY